MKNRDSDLNKYN